MASERVRHPAVSSALACALVAFGCGGEARFPLREPLWNDPDRAPFAPAPAPYVSPFAWDGANQIVFRPITRFFAVDPAGRAVNVNALDEVPDSSWFENRIGRRALTHDELVSGPCGEQVLDGDMPERSWIIDKGKPNGANPGFRVDVPGVGKFLLKGDAKDEPERATGASAIASRVYHAAGYFAPCDSVVYFDPAVLELTPGLVATDNAGVSRPFDEDALQKVLAQASHRGGRVRMGASRWLPGTPLGPYRYEGMRYDDPNDVIPHEDRRELRGARLLAAWLNHFDTREQNTLDVFIADPSDPTGRRGHVRHYILDFGDSFGSIWASDEVSKRLGHAYYLDVPYMIADFFSFGLVERPWERAERRGGIFHYFSARDFDPGDWRSGYPNPAFVRMTEGDAAWMARILARFDDRAIDSLVSVGQFDVESSRYLAATLRARRDVILRRYLTRLSPISDLRIDGTRLCGVDLARRTGVVPRETLSYRARFVHGERPVAVPAERLEATPDGALCVALPRPSATSERPRYLVLELDNGYAAQPLRAHLYEHAAAGSYRLVGIERE